MCMRNADRLFSVDNPVIVAQGEIHHRANDDLIVDGDGAFHDIVHPQDAALRRIEDRGGEKRAVDAAVGDRKSAPLHLVNR